MRSQTYAAAAGKPNSHSRQTEQPQPASRTAAAGKPNSHSRQTEQPQPASLIFFAFFVHFFSQKPLTL
jgi:hypothetical protein